MRNGLVVLALMVGTGVAAQQPANPRQQPGASITMFAPEQQDLYDGHYILSANRIYMVGGLNDPVGWAHMDNDATTVKPVAGTAEIDVNDLTNTGKFEARASSQTGRGNPKISKRPTILFMCPHGAAKSVLASAYFQRLAKERGLNVHVESAGTEPDATVSSAVAAHLKGQGYTIPIAKPRKVAPEEFAAADVVISIGCDLAALPQPRGRLVRWDEVPALSDGFTAADEAIRKRVNDLVEELVRSMPKTK